MQFRELGDMLLPQSSKYTVDNDNNIRKVSTFSSRKPKGQPEEADALCSLGLVLSTIDSGHREL